VQGMSQANLDVAVGMIFSNVIAFFIVVVTATVLFSKDSSAGTAAEIAQALEPVAGSYAKYLFAIGIVGAGLLASSTPSSCRRSVRWRPPRLCGYGGRRRPDDWVAHRACRASAEHCRY
jgi:Mn2+/Fe2+ NRAMP family transporter